MTRISSAFSAYKALAVLAFNGKAQVSGVDLTGHPVLRLILSGIPNSARDVLPFQANEAAEGIREFFRLVTPEKDVTFSSLKNWRDVANSVVSVYTTCIVSWFDQVVAESFHPEGERSIGETIIVEKFMALRDRVCLRIATDEELFSLLDFEAVLRSTLVSGSHVPQSVADPVHALIAISGFLDENTPVVDVDALLDDDAPFSGDPTPTIPAYGPRFSEFPEMESGLKEIFQGKRDSLTDEERTAFEKAIDRTAGGDEPTGIPTASEAAESGRRKIVVPVAPEDMETPTDRLKKLLSGDKSETEESHPAADVSEEKPATPVKRRRPRRAPKAK